MKTKRWQPSCNATPKCRFPSTSRIKVSEERIKNGEKSKTFTCNYSLQSNQQTKNGSAVLPLHQNGDTSDESLASWRLAWNIILKVAKASQRKLQRFRQHTCFPIEKHASHDQFGLPNLQNVKTRTKPAISTLFLQQRPTTTPLPLVVLPRDGEDLQENMEK